MKFLSLFHKRVRPLLFGGMIAAAPLPAYVYDGWYFLLQDAVWADTSQENGIYEGVSGEKIIFRREEKDGFVYRFVDVVTLEVQDRPVPERPLFSQDAYYVLREGGNYGQGARPLHFYDWDHNRLWTMEDPSVGYPFGVSTPGYFVAHAIFDALTGNSLEIPAVSFEGWSGWGANLFISHDDLVVRRQNYTQGSTWLHATDWREGTVRLHAERLIQPSDHVINYLNYLGHEDLIIDTGGQIYRARTMERAGFAQRYATHFIPLPGGAFLAADLSGEISLHEPDAFAITERFYAWELHALNTHSGGLGDFTVVGDRLVYRHTQPHQSLNHEPGVYIIDAQGLLATMRRFLPSESPVGLEYPAATQEITYLGSFDGLLYLHEPALNRVSRYEWASGLLVDHASLPPGTLITALNERRGYLATVDTHGSIRVLKEFASDDHQLVLWRGGRGRIYGLGWLDDAVYLDHREWGADTIRCFAVSLDGRTAHTRVGNQATYRRPSWLSSLQSIVRRTSTPTHVGSTEVTFDLQHHLGGIRNIESPVSAYPDVPREIPYRQPFRDSPFKPYFATGSGYIVETPGMTPRHNLETLVDEAVWTRSLLLGLTAEEHDTTVRAWATNDFSLTAQTQAPGEPVALHERQGAISVLTRDSGGFLLTHLHEDLSQVAAARPLSPALFHGIWQGRGWRHAGGLNRAYTVVSDQWVFIEDLGWFSFARGGDGVWLWSFEHGWHYTLPEMLPLVYRASTAEWVCLSCGVR